MKKLAGKNPDRTTMFTLVSVSHAKEIQEFILETQYETEKELRNKLIEDFLEITDRYQASGLSKEQRDAVVAGLRSRPLEDVCSFSKEIGLYRIQEGYHGIVHIHQGGKVLGTSSRTQ